MADGTNAPGSDQQSAVRERIDQILDRVNIPANRFCEKGDSFSTLGNADKLMELLDAIESVAAGGCEFEMPDIGPYTMSLLRSTVRDAVKYAAEVNDLQLTLRTHADIGDLEKHIAMYKLDAPENLNLDEMAKTAEKLDIPLWMLLIPGLAKHKELLKPGALKPLQAVVEQYLESGAVTETQTPIEEAYNDLGEIGREVDGLESLARCVHMAIDSAEATDTDDGLCAARSVAFRVVEDLRRLSEEIDQLSIKLHHARWPDAVAKQSGVE